MDSVKKNNTVNPKRELYSSGMCGIIIIRKLQWMGCLVHA